MMAGVLWRLVPGAVGDAMLRDIAHLRHPLAAFLMIVVGARMTMSAGLPLLLGYPLLAIAGGLAARAMIRGLTGPIAVSASERQSVAPAVFPVAFALSTVRAAGPQADLLLGRRSPPAPSCFRSFPLCVRARSHTRETTSGAGARDRRGGLGAERSGPATTSGSAGTALALGFTLLGAWIAGDLLRRLQLPRLTGYLLFGVLVGPYLGNVITTTMAGAAAGHHRHRHDAHRAHRRPDAQPRTARPAVRRDPATDRRGPRLAMLGIGAVALAGVAVAADRSRGDRVAAAGHGAADGGDRRHASRRRWRRR